MPNVLQVADKKVWFDCDGARFGDTPNMVIDCASVADTHLIAAAPALLEALQNYSLPVDLENIHQSMAEFGERAVQIELQRRAAIAKAQGGAA
jgi:hypothetical protein